MGNAGAKRISVMKVLCGVINIIRLLLLVLLLLDFGFYHATTALAVDSFKNLSKDY